MLPPCKAYRDRLPRSHAISTFWFCYALTMAHCATTEALIPHPPPTAQTQLDDQTLADSVHDGISRGLYDLARRFDRLFGEDRLLDETRKTRVRIRTGLKYDRLDSLSFLSGISLRLALPRLENRLQLLIDDTLELVEPEEAGGIRELRDDAETDTALRYILRHDARRHLNLDFGFRSGDPVQLLARLRGRIQAPYPVWQLRLTETLSWYSEDGWRNRSKMLWNRKLNDAHLLESATSLEWREGRRGLTPAQSLSLYRQIDDRRALRLRLEGRWGGWPDVSDAVYELSATYRRQWFRRWMVIECKPFLNASQTEGYRLNPGIRVTSEILFSVD